MFLPLKKLPCIHMNIIQQTIISQSLHQVPPLLLARHAEGARILEGRLIPLPFTDRFGPFAVLALLTRLESRNKTITVMSSWKWRRTPRSIFFKSEYLISLFFAASCIAVFTNLLALPCIKVKQSWLVPPIFEPLIKLMKIPWSETQLSYQYQLLTKKKLPI